MRPGNAEALARDLAVLVAAGLIEVHLDDDGEPQAAMCVGHGFYLPEPRSSEPDAGLSDSEDTHPGIGVTTRRDPDRAAGGDRELVAALVELDAGVAADLLPRHRVRLERREQRLPQLLVLHRLLGRRSSSRAPASRRTSA